MENYETNISSNLKKKTIFEILSASLIQIFFSLLFFIQPTVQKSLKYQNFPIFVFYCLHCVLYSIFFVFLLCFKQQNMKTSASQSGQNRGHKKTKTKLLTSTNMFSEKYIQLTKDKPFHQTPKKQSTPSRDIHSPRAKIPKTSYSNSRRPTSPYATKTQKININMEIKNFNIYNSHNTHSTIEVPKKKKLHKKTISALNSPNHHPYHVIHAKPSQKENLKHQKKVKHCKAKSQQNLKTNAKEWGKLLTNLGKNPKDEQNDIVAKYAVCNRCGFCPQKKKKANQDTYFIIENFMKKNRYLFGVCDGHGVNGHYVSEFIKQILPQNIEYFFLKNKSMNKPVKVSVQSSIKEAFHKTSKDLLESGIDTMFSGTTTCLVYIDKNELYCSNLGDSRAVMFSKVNNHEDLDEWEYSDLSTDHKAEDKRQALRIQMNGGRVFPYRDEDGEQMGPFRVWVKQQNVPGLAMTRSFGDYVASTVGVIDEPQILHHTIVKQNKFLVIASDGLWEFISSQEVARIMASSYIRNDPQSGIKDLEKAAVEAWMQEDDSIDDITIVVVFFKYY